LFKKQYNLFLILFLLISVNIILNSNGYNFSNIQNQNSTQPQEVLSWTVMLYFCADSRDYYVESSLNNSANFINESLNKTVNGLKNWYISSGSETDLNVIVLYDKPYTPSDILGRAKIYKLEFLEVIELEDWGQTNMGDGDTLEDFIDYCKTYYPATNYALTLSDHGRGYAGFCYDYHAPHPSYEYALGDCLTVEEVGDALDNTGGVDVLFLNTCLGGSFEAMWQFTGSVDYAVAGESSQTYKCLHHPQDILEELSADPSMTPYEVAQHAFDKAVDPEHVPLDGNPEQWPTVCFYDLDAFTSAPSLTGGTVNFKDVFGEFCDVLYTELHENITLKRPFFATIRNETIYEEEVFHSGSMMLDLRHFIEIVLSHSDEFINQDDLETTCDLLLYLLTPGTGKPIVAEEHLPQNVWYYNPNDRYANVTSFSICFPNSHDMYQEFLYPNFYENLEISYDTYWENFIFDIYPKPPELMYPFHIPEYYEIWINPIDPVIDLHIFLVYDPLMHVGACPPKANPFNMGVELGIEGAEYFDDFLTGTKAIRLPTSTFESMNRAADPLFEIVINATAATVPNQQLDLTVKHVNNSTIVWQDSQQATFEAGEVLSCVVNSNNEMTDLEPEQPPTTTSPPETSTPPTSETNSTTPEETASGFIGPAYALIATTSSLLLVTMVIIIKRKKN
jgi:hypothetical protein